MKKWDELSVQVDGRRGGGAAAGVPRGQGGRGIRLRARGVTPSRMLKGKEVGFIHSACRIQCKSTLQQYRRYCDAAV